MGTDKLGVCYVTNVSINKSREIVLLNQEVYQKRGNKLHTESGDWMGKDLINFTCYNS
jgi:hypothetical protein